MKPVDIYDLSPREFGILMGAETEKRYDEYEFEARVTMMRESATRAKRPKMSDLFQRPTSADHTDEKMSQKAAEAEHAQEWLGQFEFDARD